MASGFERLPDLVLLNVINFISLEDIFNLAQLSGRLNCICLQNAAIRNISIEENYAIADGNLKDFIQQKKTAIRTLNFNHCYWLPSKLVTWTVENCTNLRSLSVIECKLKMPAFVSLLTRLSQLATLAFSVQSFNDLRKDVFTPCQNILKHLKSLHVFYNSREVAVMQYLGEHQTIFDHCDSLEHIHIGCAGMAIPELYRPIVTEPSKLTKLKSMCISSNIHSGAQMLFYGTLSQLPNHSINFETLLMPNVNFCEFMRKDEFKPCLQNISQLKHLDIYGTKVSFPLQFINALVRASELEYLNLGSSCVTEAQLSLIASHCRKLTSLNLFNCSEVIQVSGKGFETLFEQCSGLRHLNISGYHHRNHTEVGYSIARSIRGLHSLSIPTCVLYHLPPRGNKRLMTSSSRDEPARKIQALKSFGASSCTRPHLPSCDMTSTPSPEPSTSTTSSRARVAPSSSDQSNSTSFLDNLVDNNPDLHELEILGVNVTSVIHQNKFIKPKNHKAFDACHEAKQVTDSTLKPLSRLTVLHKLTLMGLPGLSSGESLCELAQSTSLHSLAIGYVSNTLLHSTWMCRAFEHMTSLRDLRIEQPNINLRRVLEAVRSCTSLQRLCIITKHSVCDATDVQCVVEQLRRLVSLQLFMGGTLTSCRAIVSSLKQKYSKLRPAFSVVIFPFHNEMLSQYIQSSIPAKHFSEVTQFTSRVATISTRSLHAYHQCSS